MATMIEAAVDAIAALVQATIDTVTLLVQPARGPIAPLVETTVDPVSLAVQAIRQAVATRGRRALGTPVQASVDPVAPVVQAVIDPLAASIEALIDAIATIIETVVDAVAATVEARFDAVAALVEPFSCGDDVIGPDCAAEQRDAGNKHADPGNIPKLPCIHDISPFSKPNQSFCPFNGLYRYPLTSGRSRGRVMSNWLRACCSGKLPARIN